MNVTVNTSGGSSQIAVGSSGVTQTMGKTPRVDEEDLKRYVRWLFEQHAVDVENSSVWEMADQFFGHELHRDDLRSTYVLMNTAEVEVVVAW